MPRLTAQRGRCSFVTSRSTFSEDQLQPKLQLAHFGAGRADSPERRVCDPGGRISPFRVVQEVERLHPEFQIRLLREVKFLRERKIPVFDSGADDFLASPRA